jgi:hypothetical protein
VTENGRTGYERLSACTKSERESGRVEKERGRDRGCMTKSERKKEIESDAERSKNRKRRVMKMNAGSIDIEAVHMMKNGNAVIENMKKMQLTASESRKRKH